MTREDIVHLASLSRLSLTETELDALAKELPSILSYVSAVTAIAADETTEVPEVGPRHNVFRRDEVTNEPESFTEALLAEMPARAGRYLQVQKILAVGE